MERDQETLRLAAITYYLVNYSLELQHVNTKKKCVNNSGGCVDPLKMIFPVDLIRFEDSLWQTSVRWIVFYFY